jgi:hypothetical protein
MHGDNCKSVYCHWDGYLEHNGKLLLEHYDSAKANYLVALGDLSSLRPNVFVPEGVEHSFEKPAEGITIFYGRDRGETSIDWQVAQNFDAFLEQCDACCAEYYYIMRDGEWFVGTTYESDARFGGKLVPLAEALAEQDIDKDEESEKSLLAKVL